MRSYLTALMLVATLGLVSCGGGNDGASTGTPVVAQATIFDPTANGGCGNYSTYGNLGCAQQIACRNALSVLNDVTGSNPTPTQIAQCISMNGVGYAGGPGYWQCQWQSWRNNCPNDSHPLFFPDLNKNDSPSFFNPKK